MSASREGPTPRPAVDVAHAMSEWLSVEFGSPILDDLLGLRKRLHVGEVPDYDAFSTAFAQAYHLVNYRKCLAVLRASAPPLTDQLVDLGCGSGAATAAALVYLASQGARKPIEVHLMDRSQRQLDLAEGILGSISHLLPFEYELRATRVELPRHQPEPVSKAGLSLVAHLLTENAGNVAEIFGFTECVTASDGMTIVVERPDDMVWDEVGTYLADSTLARSGGDISVQEPLPLADEKSWGARWRVLEQPRADALAGAVRRYFDAWRTRDPRRLVSVFAENARYYSKPFLPPIMGLADIKQYWREEVVPQSEVALAMESVAYGPCSAHLEWRARFVRDRLQYVLKGAMTIEVDLGTGLIRELREYYRSAPTEDAGGRERRSGSGNQ